MKDWFSSTVSSSNLSSELTTVGEEEVEEGGGEERQLIRECSKLDISGTGMGEGE
jgi:hypothetical protein